VCVLTTELGIARRLKRPFGFPRAVLLLLAGELILALGVGLTQPYVVVLLHSVRGLSLVAATGLWALGPVVTIAGNAVAGTLIDRRGGRLVMISGLVMVAVSGLLLAYGPGLASAAGGVALAGLGWSFALPALATRLAILAPEDVRPRVYTIQYVLFNLGMAIGAAAGGVAFVKAAPDTPTGRSILPLLWVAAAILCLVTIVLSMLAGRQMSSGSTDDQVRLGGYRHALRDGTLIRIIVAAALLSTVGYGIYNSAPSVLALAVDDPVALTMANVAACAAIVIGSPLALRLTTRISARTALLCTAAMWALAWAICIPSALADGLGTRWALTGAAILIGAGELLLAGALPTLVNGIAPDALRGRYNALSTLAITTGMAAGPLLTSAATAVGSIVVLLYTAIVLAGLGGILLLRNPTRAQPMPIAEVSPGLDEVANR
jgi:MFS family permease